MYTARVALEREYAGKLQGLVRKFSDKKAKAGASFVTGIGNEELGSEYGPQSKVSHRSSLRINEYLSSILFRVSTLNVAYDRPWLIRPKTISSWRMNFKLLINT
jgi:hypothetical protein